MSQQDKQIIAAGIDSQFCDMLPSDFEKQLREKIGVILTMYAIKKIPDNLEFKLLQTFLKTHFQRFTIKEFYLAFELNLLREDDSKPQHFQNFSIEFISAVLKYFLYLKTDALGSLKRSLPSKELPEHKSTPKDFYDRLISFIKDKKILPSYWNWPAVYDHMEATGLVTETDEELKNFKLHVKAGVKTQANLDKLKAADAIERARIEDSFKPENMAKIYKTEYVKMKLSKEYFNGKIHR